MILELCIYFFFYRSYATSVVLIVLSFLGHLIDGWIDRLIDSSIDRSSINQTVFTWPIRNKTKPRH